MPDFTTLLRKPAGQAKRAAVLPQADYPGIIKAWEVGESSQKKTPFIRFQVGLIGWSETVPESSRVDPESGEEINVSRRTYHSDFYLTEDALIMLDDFLRSCGLDPEGRTYEEVIPDTIGCQVLATVQQSINENVNPPTLTNPPWLKALRGQGLVG